MESNYQGKSINVQKIAAKIAYEDAYKKHISRKSIDEIIEIAVAELKQSMKRIAKENPNYVLTDKEEHELECLYRKEMKAHAYL